MQYIDSFYQVYNKCDVKTIKIYKFRLKIEEAKLLLFYSTFNTNQCNFIKHFITKNSLERKSHFRTTDSTLYSKLNYKISLFITVTNCFRRI